MQLLSHRNPQVTALGFFNVNKRIIPKVNRFGASYRLKFGCITVDLFCFTGPCNDVNVLFYSTPVSIVRAIKLMTDEW